MKKFAVAIDDLAIAYQIRDSDLSVEIPFYQ